MRRLVAEGVTTIFTLSGNQIMPVFDAVVDAGVRLVHVRHEAAAVHMADAFGQLTGEPGVALVTAGPGFANGLSALYGALRAESPMVLLAGHAPLRELGRGAFQEMPQSDLAAPFTKSSWLARDPSRLASDLARAMRIARSGRPGPVQLSLPFDVLEATVDDEDTADTVDAPLPSPTADNLGDLVASLKAARRPLLIHGPAACRGQLARQVREIARRWRLPVVGMSSPRGLKDPSLGAFGEVLPSADLILLLGKEPDYMLRFGSPPAVAGDARFVHVAPDETALARARELLGDRLALQFRAELSTLLTALAASELEHGGDPAWLVEVEAAIATRTVSGRVRSPGAPGPLHPADLAQAIQPILDRSERSVLIQDGGEFGQWAQAHLRAPRRITNGPSGAIGASLPFAIAARIVEPEAPIVAVMGDGTVGFHIAELDTAVRNDTPFLAVVGNDACWNAEHQIQLREYGPDRTIGCELLPTRYDRVAAGFGAFGVHVDDEAELAPALARAEASGKPALVDVTIERHPAPSPRLGRS